MYDRDLDEKPRVVFEGKEFKLQNGENIVEWTLVNNLVHNVCSWWQIVKAKLESYGYFKFVYKTTFGITNVKVDNRIQLIKQLSTNWACIS